MCCVYMHTSPSGKKYIGITIKKPQYRWNDGKGYKRNNHFYKAIQKYGWENFKHEIIFEDIEYDKATEIEKQLIKEHKSNQREFGYNKSEGGDKSATGTKHTPETIEKYKKSAKIKGDKLRGTKRNPEVVKKIKENNAKYWLGKKGKEHPSYGSKKSLEERLEISKRMKGKNNPRYGIPPKNIRKVAQYDLVGNLIKIWDCAEYAARHYNIARTGIVKNCRTMQGCKGYDRKTAAGFVWQYV